MTDNLPSVIETSAPDSVEPPAIGWWGWTWRSAVFLLVVGGLYFGVRLLYEMGLSPLFAPVPAMTIGHDTTRIDGPVDEKGYIDYIAAIDDDAERDTTPDANGAAALYQVIGPSSIPVLVRERFFGRLGIAVPSEEGAYLIDPDRQGAPRGLTDEEQKEREQRELAFNRAWERPWKRDEFPEVAAWVDANHEALDRLAAASRRPRWYVPVRMSEHLEEPLGGRSLTNLDVSHVTEVRGAGRMLARRAMLRLGEGDFAGAWDDGESIDRLGAQIGQGPCLIEWLIQLAMHRLAGQVFEAIARDLRMDEKTRAALCERHHHRPPCTSLADRVDRGERFAILEAIRIFALQANSSGPPASIDWNEALRQVNPQVDALVKALRIQDLRQRRAAVAAAEGQLDAWMAQRTEIGYWVGAWFAGESSRTLRGRATGFIIVSLMLPATGAASDGEAGWRIRHDAVELTFALATYHTKHGRYPQALTELVPEEIEQLPDDLDAPVPRPMVYVPTNEGYVLFSDDSPAPSTAPPERGSHAFSRGLIFRVPWPPEE